MRGLIELCLIKPCVSKACVSANPFIYRLAIRTFKSCLLPNHQLREAKILTRVKRSSRHTCRLCIKCSSTSNKLLLHSGCMKTGTRAKKHPFMLSLPISAWPDCAHSPFQEQNTCHAGYISYKSKLNRHARDESLFDSATGYTKNTTEQVTHFLLPTL